MEQGRAVSIGRGCLFDRFALVMGWQKGPVFCMRLVLAKIFLLLTFPLMSFSSTAGNVNYSDREDVKLFVQQMVENDSFITAELLTVFRQATYKQSIIDAISRPAEKVLTWSEYQDIFLTDRRVREGYKFMLENARALSEAYKKYGVPPVIVTAIIGVETMYGKRRGNYRVLDALTTLAFDYPPRAEFFQRELREFLLLVREEDQSIFELQGSYAGAMGYGQFIPSSYRRYSVDFNGDGTRDIWNNKMDAIGSVANYFSEHGWRPGEPVVARATVEVSDDRLDAVFNVSLKPSTTTGAMRKIGVVTELEIGESMKVSPMKLAGKDGDEYWLGFHNFYVITRYNHSKLYAMAIFQLSEALRTSDGIVSYRVH